MHNYNLQTSNGIYKFFKQIRPDSYLSSEAKKYLLKYTKHNSGPHLERDLEKMFTFKNNGPRKTTVTLDEILGRRKSSKQKSSKRKSSKRRKTSKRKSSKRKRH
jgi:hypothetical protein